MATTADQHQASLSPVEQRLIEHVECGDVLDLAGDQPVDEAAMLSWDDTRTISATVIRDILRGRHVTDPDPRGLRLRGARISGRLDLENITSAMSLVLVDCFLELGINARDANLKALVLVRCRLSHPTEPPLDGTRLTTTDVFLSHTIVDAHAAGGAVRLLGAHLGGLDCDGARLVNDSGPALHADNLQVDQNMFLHNGFQATASGEQAAVRLFGAHVGGQLNCSGARLINDAGPALLADRLQVDQNMVLRNGFQATASSEQAAVRLLGAHVGGQLNCSGARLINDAGPALNAYDLRVDQAVFLGGDFRATASGEDVVLDLSDTHIGGVMSLSPNDVKHRRHPHHKLRLDGLTYTGLPRGVTPARWLALLRHGTIDYAAQPYQHLAAAHRAAGHDREARHVLIAQRQDQIRRHALTGRTARTWARLTGLLIGYGYKPWRALIALAAVLAAAVTTAIILGGTYGALAQVRTPPPATPAPCSWVEHVGVGLDLGTPLLITGTRTRCDTTNTTPGHILTITGWTLRLLAWAFATLFIAGFTSAVRKT